MKLRELIQPGNFSHRGEGPKYMQLRNVIRKAILSGALAHEDALPAERDIAEFSGLSRVTVRNAIKLLVNDGTLIQRRGSGSFVSAPSKDMQQSTTLLASFSTEMARRGLTGRSIWLERGHFPPSPDEIFALGLPQNSKVTRLVRVRCADDRPMAVERAVLPITILPEPDSVGDSLYATLSELGHAPARAVQKISAVNLGKSDAKLLNVPQGSAGLKIERVSYLADETASEFTRSLYRGDAYEFVADLTPNEFKSF